MATEAIAHGPAWANGCEQCRYGIVNYDKPHGGDSLYMERLVLAVDGALEFCTCQAGHMMRQYLRRQYKAVQAITVTLSGMEQSAGEMMLDQARRHVSARVPNIHWSDK